VEGSCVEFPTAGRGRSSDKVAWKQSAVINSAALSTAPVSLVQAEG
jgi:hypothetical protein